MLKDKQMVEWIEEIELHIHDLIDSINSNTDHDFNAYLNELKLIYNSCTILGNVKTGKTRLVGVCYEKTKKKVRD